MSQPNIQAEKIHSPIQLMAAWFVMLILLSGVLLGAASQIENPTWAAGYLVISTTILILIVIGTVVLMLTKYRPHLQEGREYAEWLKEQNRFSEGKVKERPGKTQLDDIKRKLDHLKLTMQDKNEASILSRVEDAILYKVNAIDVKGASTLLKAIQEFGVSTELFHLKPSASKGTEDHQSIWLGKSVPAHVAVPIIKKAHSIWPHLRYIGFFSDDAPEETKWQIFFGGATSTALQRGYLPWSAEDINQLNPEDENSFHEMIQEKLP